MMLQALKAGKAVLSRKMRAHSPVSTFSAPRTLTPTGEMTSFTIGDGYNDGYNPSHNSCRRADISVQLQSRGAPSLLREWKKPAPPSATDPAALIVKDVRKTLLAGVLANCAEKGFHCCLLFPSRV